MSASRLRDIYQRALNNPKGPFEYQVTLGLQPISDRSLDLPTGSGKTATAVLSWLYQREVSPETTPRRLVYCLPMRALVEQTRRTVDLWLKNLSLSDSVIAATLMGGEVEQDWECEPTKPAILIGTQDMLLSRALNRGFAMSRFRWPVHFALVNKVMAEYFREPYPARSTVGVASLPRGAQVEVECVVAL